MKTLIFTRWLIRDIWQAKIYDKWNRNERNKNGRLKFISPAKKCYTGRPYFLSTSSPAVGKPRSPMSEKLTKLESCVNELRSVFQSNRRDIPCEIASISIARQLLYNRLVFRMARRGSAVRSFNIPWRNRRARRLALHARTG